MEKPTTHLSRVDGLATEVVVHLLGANACDEATERISDCFAEDEERAPTLVVEVAVGDEATSLARDGLEERRAAAVGDLASAKREKGLRGNTETSPSRRTEDDEHLAATYEPIHVVEDVDTLAFAARERASELHRRRGEGVLVVRARAMAVRREVAKRQACPPSRVVGILRLQLHHRLGPGAGGEVGRGRVELAAFGVVKGRARGSSIVGGDLLRVSRVATC